ncbi:dTDP-4-dehydrorhamnose reductase [Corynebacterium efficiens YS-314]|uniref:dTDP-4-dehydrorhamnose reductase n=1 Tax=Corynebacterium efficiens (strain DSM 44549 / YS-314 / AJ 12310 / JCM 11189 / NBRC 100395) TaxID=196164 RepID=Q8FSN9_COREF|nr:bifunctional dTDP-4-dehydrorhamnose 3,5-epimerase family protein/NAD(P)-dependent oxidoreductase [Corynebacterium efficiens]EEW50928.1 dTDP-4-dehydrorhamnose reductase [Corynebacterium efficiens YS-314]BAC17153.1 putative dTDP-4-keto-6-deoxyglucose-3,5-epimerase and dTDP-6-deoxy-L-mannose-dehydrogenase [Corynebacterium efficiens YS-314]
MTSFNKELTVRDTAIDGLLIVDFPVHGDNRGWFKENWQRQKMLAVGLPDFGPVQNNMSFNATAGTTRGLHAEPWDKFVSVGTGRVFGAWCDLREGSATYGAVVTQEITPDIGVYVPRGVANGFQALEDETLYTYLVNDHWSPDAQYSNVNLADPALGIEWPLPLTEMSEKDKNHPMLVDATGVPARKVLVTGAGGQLGTALRAVFPDAEFVSRQDLDITSDLSSARPWKQYSAIINAAAYTAVDKAEGEGRADAWAVNATAVANLAAVARENNLTLVHVSSDYVFDGTAPGEYTEDAPLSPLGVYGQTKAAGDLAATGAPQHYVVRTSWVIGDGGNFVRTMKSLDARGITPSVVDDQIGRLSFTQDIAAGIKHLLDTRAAYGTYNLTNSGEPASWADVARMIFRDPAAVTGVSTAEYFVDKQGAAPRPLNSRLDLGKLTATGFTAPDWRARLADYLEEL